MVVVSAKIQAEEVVFAILVWRYSFAILILFTVRQYVSVSVDWIPSSDLQFELIEDMSKSKSMMSIVVSTCY